MLTTYEVSWLSFEDNALHSRVLDFEHEIEAWQLAYRSLTDTAEGSTVGLTKEELKEMAEEVGMIGVREVPYGGTETDD